MPLSPFTMCHTRVDLIRPAALDCRHVAWNGCRLLVIPKFDVLRV